MKTLQLIVPFYRGNIQFPFDVRGFTTMEKARPYYNKMCEVLELRQDETGFAMGSNEKGCEVKWLQIDIDNETLPDILDKL